VTEQIQEEPLEDTWVASIEEDAKRSLEEDFQYEDDRALTPRSEAVAIATMALETSPWLL
jgi:hypothetical protein